MPKLLVTGSGGLIGSQTVKFFAEKGFEIVGIDNDMRSYFFGKEASTQWNVDVLKSDYKDTYVHYDVDIRHNDKIEAIFREHPFDAIVHTAAQPSHDWAANEPFTDFSINANGTLVLLENVRKYCRDAVFIFTSTNKVYGDIPNGLPLVEQDSRYEIAHEHDFFHGIDETMSIDACKHSLFGASKVAADILVQEYGRYFEMKTGIFRAGCLTGPAHSGAELHGFLAYLAKCIATGREYNIFGYKGKQVRDNIHSYDLVTMFWHFYNESRCGEVYNAGGGRFSNISMLEAIDKIEKLISKKAQINYLEQNRMGDHIWYISSLKKFQDHYPHWEQKYDMDMILHEICTMGHF